MFGFCCSEYHYPTAAKLVILRVLCYKVVTITKPLNIITLSSPIGVKNYMFVTIDEF